MVTVRQSGTKKVNIYQSGVFKITQPAIGTVNGVNTVFAANVPFVPGSIEVYVNGLKEKHFSLVGETAIELESPPKATGFSDYVELIYLSK